jgi:DNA-binding response OmpR family regulator
VVKALSYPIGAGQESAGMRILVVEDDAGVRETLRDLLDAAGHHVITATGFAEAQALLRRRVWDVMLTDLILPGGSGLDLAAEAKAQGLGAIVCSGHPTTIAQLQNQGVTHLVKPFSAEALETALRAVTQRG